jgi:hypothetical protein
MGTTTSLLRPGVLLVFTEPGSQLMDNSGASWWIPWVSSGRLRGVKQLPVPCGDKLASSKLRQKLMVFPSSIWTPLPSSCGPLAKATPISP